MPRVTGTGVATSDGVGVFWTPKPDTSTELKILCNIADCISATEFSDWDQNPAMIWVETAGDPGHQLPGIGKKTKTYVPIGVKGDNGEVEIKVYPAGRGVARDLAALEDELGPMAGSIVKLRRQGSGMTTSYSVIPMGKTQKVTETLPDMDDVFDALGPSEAEDVKSMIIARLGLSDWSSVVEHYNNKADDDSVAF